MMVGAHVSRDVWVCGGYKGFRDAQAASNVKWMLTVSTLAFRNTQGI